MRARRFNQPSLPHTTPIAEYRTVGGVAGPLVVVECVKVRALALEEEGGRGTFGKAWRVASDLLLAKHSATRHADAEIDRCALPTQH